MSEKSIQAAWDKWEDENPKKGWSTANIDAVVAKHSFSAKCKTFIPIYYKASKPEDAYNEYIAGGGDKKDIWYDNGSAIVEGVFASPGFAKTSCTADVKEYKKNATTEEILDYEYELAQATAVYDQEVAEPLKDIGADAASDIYRCATEYSGAASTLKEAINEFWNEAATKLFDGTVPAGAKHPAGHFGGGSGKFTNELGEHGSLLSGLVDGGAIDQSHYAVLTYTDDSGSISSQPNNWDHIIVTEDKLLYSETLINDGGNLSTADGTVVIDSSNIASFPLYYASLAIVVVNQASQLAHMAPTTEQIKGIEQGTPGATVAVVDNISNGADARGTESGSFGGKGNLGTPYGMTSEMDPYFAPKNSLETWAIDTGTASREGADEATKWISNFGGGRGEWSANEPQNISWRTKDAQKYAMTAAEQITKYYKEDPKARELQVWLLERLSGIGGLIDTIAEASDCIKDEFDDLLDAIDDNNADFDKALSDRGGKWNNWFADKSLNAALSTTIEASSLDPSKLMGGTAEKVIFRQQCFLLTYVNRLAGYKKYALESVVKDKRSICTKRLPYVPHDFMAPEDKPDIPYNACLQIDGDPYGFINKLTQSPSYSKFFDIENWQISGLQPRIRLFKVIYDDNNQEREIEIKFDSHFSSDEMDYFKTKKSRGVGVGLKNFEFIYDGSNPFAAKKSIKASLKLHATSFGELFEDRKGKLTGPGKEGPAPKGTASYKYADLALKTLFKEKTGNDKASKWDLIMDENANLAKLNFRLKAVVGWSKPAGKLGGHSESMRSGGGPSAAEIRRAASESFVTLNLTPTVHDFEFDDQGKVTFTINYLAYVEDFFDQGGFNTFADPTGEIGLAREVRKLKMKKYSKECSESNSEAVEELKKEYAEKAVREQKSSIHSIITELTRLDRIYYLTVNPDVIKSFVSYGPYADKEHLVVGTEQLIYNSDDIDTQIKNDIATALQTAGSGVGGYAAGASSDDEMKLLRASLVGLTPDKTYVPFFYISDLIDVVLKNIGKELEYLSENLDKLDTKEKSKIINDDLTKRVRDIKKYVRNFTRLRILLGPVELKQMGSRKNYDSMKGTHYGITNTQSNATDFVNFGDLPISVSYFVEFLAEKVFRRDNTYYSLTKMMNDLFHGLIDKFMNNKSCFAFDISQRVRINQNVLTSYSPAATKISNGTLDELTALMGLKSSKLKAGKMTKGSPARLNTQEAIVKNYTGGKRPILNISGQANQEDDVYAPLSNEINYMTFFAARTRPVDRMTGTKEADLQGGIFHYLLGRNKGIVKNIKLRKTQTPGLQEVRFEQEGYEGLEQLRVVYDVEIDCFANVNAFPGTYIYIPPRGFDPSVGIDMTKYGVGGYYMIYRSSHNFSAGNAGTTIQAKWVAQLETDADAAAQGRAQVSTSPGKCGLHRRKASTEI